jgi:hypothetical protein
VPAATSFRENMRISSANKGGDMHSARLLVAVVALAGTVAVTPTAVAAPANDDFADAASLRFPGVYPGDLAGATKEPGEDMHYSTHTVWYRFRPGRTRRVTLHFAATGYDCRLWLYRGSALGSLALVKSGGGVVADSAPEPMPVTVRRGVLYHLAVSCEEMENTHFVLDLRNGSLGQTGVALDINPELSLRSLRRQGLTVSARSRRPATVRIELRVSRTTARHLGLASRVLGRTTGAVDRTGSLWTVVRLTRAARHALAAADGLTATARLTATRPGAARRVATAPIRL